jgi:hypothetical protein
MLSFHPQLHVRYVIVAGVQLSTERPKRGKLTLIEVKSILTNMPSSLICLFTRPDKIQPLTQLQAPPQSILAD